MRIILLDNVEKLGNAGDVVKVKDGFARNYLIPKKQAVIATNKSLKTIEAIKQEAQKKADEQINQLREMAKKLEGLKLEFVRRADENDHLYGSVSDIDVANAINEKGFAEIHKSMIKGEKHIKELGEFDITIHIAPGIDTFVKVVIKKEEE